MESSSSRPYQIQNQTKLMINQEEFSDVCFLLGPQRERIYGHRVLLSAGSDVFKAMLFGELRESGNEIVVPDISPSAFLIMMKYIYCNELEFELFELYETAFVADKYMVHNMLDALIDRVRERLNDSTCCLIFDQLTKLQSDKTNLLLSETREYIKSNSRAVFQSNEFLQIDEDALIALLSFERLNISEIDLLKACCKWLESEIGRSNLPLSVENKRSAFQPIKHLIRWRDLKASQVASFGEICCLLDDKELASLLMHLLNPINSLPSKWQSFSPSRTVGLQSVTLSKFALVRRLTTYQVLVKVDKKVCIKTIRTGVRHDASRPDTTLSVLASGEVLNLKIEKFLHDAKWCFKFTDELVVEANSEYQFFLKQQGSASVQWSRAPPVLVETFDGFTFSNVNTYEYAYHLIEKVEFFEA